MALCSSWKRRDGTRRWHADKRALRAKNRRRGQPRTLQRGALDEARGSDLLPMRSVVCQLLLFQFSLMLLLALAVLGATRGGRQDRHDGGAKSLGRRTRAR